MAPSKRSTPPPPVDPDAPDFVAGLLRTLTPRERRDLERIQAAQGLRSLEAVVVRLRRLHALGEALAAAGDAEMQRRLQQAGLAGAQGARWISTADRRWARRTVARQAAQARRRPGRRSEGGGDRPAGAGA